MEIEHECVDLDVLRETLQSEAMSTNPVFLTNFPKISTNASFTEITLLGSHFKTLKGDREGVEVKVGKSPCQITFVDHQFVVCELHNVTSWSGTGTVAIRINGSSVACSNCSFQLLNNTFPGRKMIRARVTEPSSRTYVEPSIITHVDGVNAYGWSVNLMLIMILAITVIGLVGFAAVGVARLRRCFHEDKIRHTTRRQDTPADFFQRFRERFYGPSAPISKAPEYLGLRQSFTSARQQENSVCSPGVDEHYYWEILERSGLDSEYEKPTLVTR